MILVEPHAAYKSRQYYRSTPAPLPVVAVVHGPLHHLIQKHRKLPGPLPNPLPDAFWEDVVCKVVEEEHGHPIRITSVVNEVARLGNYSTRASRDAARLKAFGLIGRLIHSGRLRRTARKYVVIGTTLATPTQTAGQASPVGCHLPVR